MAMITSSISLRVDTPSLRRWGEEDTTSLRCTLLRLLFLGRFGLFPGFLGLLFGLFGLFLRRRVRGAG
jgi:hypothetical protein